MTTRAYNFSAGPATLPTEVLEASAAALVDYQGSGVGIGEVSHRGKQFDAVRAECEAAVRELMGISDDYAVLFLQGGATHQFEMIPMNLLQNRAEYVISGQWAKKAAAAAKRYGQIDILGDSSDTNFDRLPAGWAASADADYLHICSNNTIFGTRTTEWPDHPCLVADMSSEIMSRVIDVDRFGLIYAGAQKNLAVAGVALVIVRRELLDRAGDIAPIFSYAAHDKAESCLNTPPTFSIYVLLETLRWLKRQGGLAAVEGINEAKAAKLYAAIDGSDGFYRGTVVDTANRSTMNVTYVLGNDDLTAAFLAGATERGLQALKGYRTVGGVRASIYNAMPEAGVDALIAWMAEFQAANS